MKYVPDLSLQSIFRMRPEGPRRIGGLPIAELDFIAGNYRKAGVAVARSAGAFWRFSGSSYPLLALEQKRRLETHL